MKDLNRFLRKNLYMVMSVLVLSLSVVFMSVTLYALNARNNIDATSVGPIYLGNQSEDDYASLLIREVGEWANSSVYRFVFQGYEYTVDLTTFTFDVATTVEDIVRNQNNLAIFSLSESVAETLFTEMTAGFGVSITDAIDHDLLTTTLLADMGNLFQRKTYDLSDFLAISLSETTLQVNTLEGLLPADVEAILAEVSEINIDASRRFSLLEQLDVDLTNDQWSILASGIQSVTLATAFTGYDFESFTELPSWADYGKNVRILLVNHYDFAFFNPLPYSYRITITAEDDDTLRFELIGYPFVSAYQIDYLDAEVIPYRTIVLDDLSLNALTPGVIVTETDTDFIYRLLMQNGIDGSIRFCERTVTPIGAEPIVLRLFNDQRLPIDEIFHENIVSKDGD